MQKIGKRALRWPVLLLALVTCYTLALLAVYAIPDRWIQRNVDSALGILEEEGADGYGYANYFWHNGYGVADYLTDRVMFKGLVRGDRTVAQGAMHTDYIRYWHGYSVLLRPLCTVLSLINLRYVNMLLVYGLLGLCYYHCRRRLGAWTAFFFGAGLVMTNLPLAAFCQQFFTVTLLTLLACYLLLRFWNKLRGWLPEYFLILGSLVCFFDFLTFPVLALGYPLLVALLLQVKERQGAKTLWANTIGLSAVWMAAYGLTWLCKAPVGTLLTGQDVLGDILAQVAFRTTGDWEYVQVSPADSILINLRTFFIGSAIGCFAMMLLAAVLRIIRGGGVYQSRGVQWLYALPVAVVALWPFAWYCVLQNHVRLHFWMTSKQLAVTVFALLAYLTAVTRDGLTEKNGL